jgi:hypothetical protein
MRAILLLFAFLLSSNSLAAQQLPEWYRVYTFDESIIEMNTTLVTFGGKDIGRVRLRWTFDQPEALSGEPQVKYKSRLEIMEFNCSQQRYRLYEVTLFDEAGREIRKEEMNPPNEWHTLSSGSVMESLFSPACALIERTKHPPVPPVVSEDTIELEKAARYALSFSQSLEQAKDFKPIIGKFFSANYLDGYLGDKETNWFLNLDPDTAARVSRAELQRFYLALMNTGYLSSVYLISQSPSDSDVPVPDERLVPPDIVQLIKTHPYTATYKHGADNFDYLAEKIDSVERLRSYTDLMEKISTIMRKHVVGVRAEHSKEYRAMLENWDWTFDLYQPKVRLCAAECFGLPKGTKLFEVNVPIFHLQIAEIKGEMRIVSAMDCFQ